MRYIGIITCAIILYAGDLFSQSRITHNNKEIFLSGMNLAWADFAKDLSNFDKTTFARALDEISAEGGNCVRWWLHINGRYTPEFTKGKVSGPGKNTIENLRTGLDMAKERNIALILCLWSFDMLQPGALEKNHERNIKLIEEKEYTLAYIDNALIPMIKALKDHPAILCWEIFNEAEGMATDIEWGGWTPATITFVPNVQRFINMAAGAIHRTDSDALVSNGCWDFKVTSDIKTIKNFINLYRDDRLIAAGNDSLGTLDFYMVHYYEWAKEKSSPFHHSASYWELDKPVVIGEFSAKGPYKGIDTRTAYEYLYKNGYAGALSWTWTGHDGLGSLKDAAPALRYLLENYPEDIVIDYSNVE